MQLYILFSTQIVSKIGTVDHFVEMYPLTWRILLHTAMTYKCSWTYHEENLSVTTAFFIMRAFDSERHILLLMSAGQFALWNIWNIWSKPTKWFSFNSSYTCNVHLYLNVQFNKSSRHSLILMHQSIVNRPPTPGGVRGIAGEMTRVLTFRLSPDCRASAGILQ